MIPFRDNMPTRTFPLISLLIFVLNLAAFGYQITLGPVQTEALFQSYSIIPAKLHETAAGAWGEGTFALSFVTSMFLHGGLMHLGGNLLYLWVFADNVEERMGGPRFAAFYLLCGLAAGWTHILFNPASTVPTIGASGAISGVLGAYVLSYPFARVRVVLPLILFWPVFELPALFVLGLWFVMQLLSGTAALGAEAGVQGVAWWAHIGGFLAGLALVPLFAKHPVREYYWAEEKDRAA